MSIIGKFPAASSKDPNDIAPVDAIGTLYYNDGTKAYLTGVERLPDSLVPVETFLENGKVLSLDASMEYYSCIIEGTELKSCYNRGILLHTATLSQPLTAWGDRGGNSSCYAYMNGSTPVLITNDSFGKIGNTVWSCHEHTYNSQIISCQGNQSETLSVDSAGVILFHDSEYSNKTYTHTLIWRAEIEGTTLVDTYGRVVIVGTVAKLLSKADGSVLCEIELGHTVSKINSDYIFCTDGTVIDYYVSLSEAKNEIGISKVMYFDKEVVGIASYYENSTLFHFVAFRDGTIVKYIGSDFSTPCITYTGNRSPITTFRTIGDSSIGYIVAGREDGTIERLEHLSGRIKVYLHEEETL